MPESNLNQLVLKNLHSSKKAQDIERYAFMLTNKFTSFVSRKNEKQGIWLCTFSSNLGKMKRFLTEFY